MLYILYVAILLDFIPPFPCLGIVQASLVSALGYRKRSLLIKSKIATNDCTNYHVNLMPMGKENVNGCSVRYVSICVPVEMLY